MKTVAIFSIKGGAGKTTTTENLSVALSQRGDSVALMDIDGTGALSDWFNLRREVAGVSPEASPYFWEVEKMGALKARHAELAATGVDWCVIDTSPSAGAANHTALELADLVIIPCKATPTDILQANKPLEICQRLQKPSYFLVNEVTGRRSGEDTVMELGTLMGGATIRTVIPRLGEVANAPGRGLTVVETAPQSSAAQSYGQLVDVVASFFKPKKGGRRNV